ncbi:MAG: ATP-binding protein [Leptolyngbyaceae cyanobacterium]
MLDTLDLSFIYDRFMLQQQSGLSLLGHLPSPSWGIGAVVVVHWSLALILLWLAYRPEPFQGQPLPKLSSWLKLISAGLVLYGIMYALVILSDHLSLGWVILVEVVTVLVWSTMGMVARSLLSNLVAKSPRSNLIQINQQLEQKIADRRQVEQSLRSTAEQLRQALEFEALLKRITDKVRDSLDEKHILQMAVQALGEGLEVCSCNAALYDLTSKMAIVHYEYTTSFAPVQGRVMSMDNTPWLYEQILAGQSFQFCSLFPNPARGRVSMLVCPIMDDNGVLGDLWLVNQADYGFGELELRLMQQVTNQCAIALRQARLYQEAQAQVKELQRLNTLKDDFLSTVSHELRTPVANVKLATRMLAVTLARRAEAFEDPTIFAQSDELVKLDQKVREKELYYLKILEDECQREIDLVNDLLDLQRLDEDRAVLDIEEINLNEWLPKTVKPFENRVSNRNQSLEIKVPHLLDSIHSDGVSLGRILTELLNNACKYTPPGEKITVEVTTRENRATFAVINSGVEIPARELPHIFDKFYRVPSTDPWKQGGTGLGLALVKSLAQHLGGTIEVQSQANQTQFIVQLPLAMAIPEVDGDTEEIEVMEQVGVIEVRS